MEDQTPKTMLHMLRECGPADHGMANAPRDQGPRPYEKSNMPTPTFMAAYGRQHLLHEDILRAEGYTPTGPRTKEAKSAMEMATLRMTSGAIYLAREPTESLTGDLMPQQHAPSPF